MLKVIFFKSSTPPNEIDDIHYENDVIKFYKRINQTDEYSYYYNILSLWFSWKDEIDFLSCLGFENIKIIRLDPYSVYEQIDKSRGYYHEAITTSNTNTK